MNIRIALLKNIPEPGNSFTEIKRVVAAADRDHTALSPEEFCRALSGGDYDIVGMSSLLTMTMPNAARTIEAMKAAGLRNRIKVMVGGAPTTAEWAEKIGADAHAKDGPTAAMVAAKLVGK